MWRCCCARSHAHAPVLPPAAAAQQLLLLPPAGGTRTWQARRALVPQGWRQGQGHVPQLQWAGGAALRPAGCCQRQQQQRPDTLHAPGYCRPAASPTHTCAAAAAGAQWLGAAHELLRWRWKRQLWRAALVPAAALQRPALQTAGSRLGWHLPARPLRWQAAAAGQSRSRSQCAQHAGELSQSWLTAAWTDWQACLPAAAAAAGARQPVALAPAHAATSCVRCPLAVSQAGLWARCQSPTLVASPVGKALQDGRSRGGGTQGAHISALACPHHPRSPAPPALSHRRPK